MAWLVLDALVFHGRQDLAWALTVGCSIAVIEMALRYRRVEWRQAVAPVHAFGAGLFGIALVLVSVRQGSSGGSVNWGWMLAAAAVLAIAPAALLLLSVREVWKRRSRR